MRELKSINKIIFQNGLLKEKRPSSDKSTYIPLDELTPGDMACLTVGDASIMMQFIPKHTVAYRQLIKLLS